MRQHTATATRRWGGSGRHTATKTRRRAARVRWPGTATGMAGAHPPDRLLAAQGGVYLSHWQRCPRTPKAATPPPWHRAGAGRLRREAWATCDWSRIHLHSWMAFGPLSNCIKISCAAWPGEVRPRGARQTKPRTRARVRHTRQASHRRTWRLCAAAAGKRAGACRSWQARGCCRAGRHSLRQTRQVLAAPSPRGAAPWGAYLPVLRVGALVKGMAHRLQLRELGGIHGEEEPRLPTADAVCNRPLRQHQGRIGSAALAAGQCCAQMCWAAPPLTGTRAAAASPSWPVNPLLGSDPSSRVAPEGRGLTSFAARAATRRAVGRG